MKTRFLFFSLFVLIIVGCVESQKLPTPNETEIATPFPSPYATELQSPAYNKSESVEIGIMFETWSRGYYSNISYYQPYFKVISNYSEWVSFLDNQGYLAWKAGEGPLRLEGSIFPGIFTKPKIMEPPDFYNYSVVAAMMGRISRAEGPEIEIKNITAKDNILKVIIAFKLGPGAAVESAPYHIVMIKKDQLTKEKSIFDFIDNEGKLLERVAGGEYKTSPSLIDTISSGHPILRNYSIIGEIEDDYYFGDLKRGCTGCEGKELDYIIRGYPKRWEGEESIVITLQNAFKGSEKLKKIEITPENATTVSFKTVAVGESSGYTSPAFMVINNMSDWADVWQKHSSYLVDQKPQVPGIDFSNETVVAVFFGESPAFETGIMDITRARRNVFVNLQKKYPASRSSVQPYFIIRMPKTTDNIIFRTLSWEYSDS